MNHLHAIDYCIILIVLGITLYLGFRFSNRQTTTENYFLSKGNFPSWQESLGRCRLLLKDGEVVVDNFAVVNYRVRKTSYYRRTQALPNQMVADIIGYHSFRRENLWVSPRMDIHWQQVT
jgi:hypothetical protein